PSTAPRPGPTQRTWWTLVDRPGEGYLETSASALFAYSLARGWRYGQVDHAALPAIERAIVGLGGRIVDDAAGRPVVRGISGPTLPGTRASYLAVPLVDDRPYGVGAVILALVESSGLPAGPPAGE
ncbi:MAG: glycoside hydrolase family 88 protein, partial [Myxococcales bacterium]|nr:glycoside hydrolase family 88 protein [Myxococcales bacterium]